MTAPPPFFTRYGSSRPDPSAKSLAIEPYPEICTAGALRATIVASAIDLVGGMYTREIAGVDATFTSDLSLRIPRPGVPDRIVARGERLRAGRRLITTGVTLEHAGTPWAYGETTFSRIPRAKENAPDLEALSTPLQIPSHPLDRALTDEVGVEVIAPETGQIQVQLRDALLNPEGVMQGALVALAVECAALARADHDGASEGMGARVVTELDLRYLAAASAGPLTGRADWIGEPSTGMLRVELRDTGQDDRLTTTALVRVDAAPG